MNSKNPPQPTVYINNVLDPETYATLERIALEKGFNVDTLIAQIVDRYILREGGSLN